MKDLSIENIVSDNKNIAIILRNNFYSDGIRFFTSDNDSQQLGYMNRPKGYEILPHRHNLIPREVHLTQEVLFIKSGSVKMDIYDLDKNFIKSCILNKGDVVLLASGGHGFTMLEKSEIIEVKTGPHIGEKDKTRFNENQIESN